MEQHIRVAMPDHLPIVGHVDPAQPQRSAGLQAMRIRADTDPKAVRNVVSSKSKP
jgi:hypothetical protein